MFVLTSVYVNMLMCTCIYSIYELTYNLQPTYHGDVQIITNTYGPTWLVSTLKGTPNLYFLSEVLAISTGRHGVLELGTRGYTH